MYAEVPEPAEIPELTDQDIAALPEDRIAALSDTLLEGLLDDLHERAARMTRQAAAAFEPVIAALELEAIRRGMTRPAITEPAMRTPVMHRLRKAAAAGDVSAFDRAMRAMDAAGLLHAYVLALEWPDAEGRAHALSRVAWNLNERVYGLHVAMTHAKHIVWSRVGPEERAARHRRCIEATLAELILAGEMQRWRQR